MALGWELVDDGDIEEVMGMFKFASTRGRDIAPVLAKITADMMRVERNVFYGQGRRGGGSWKPLKQDTIRKKGIGGANILRTDLAKSGYSKIDGSPSSDTLFKSLTQEGAPYQILEVSRNSVTFGTSRPYAGAHQFGSWLRYIPARPFLSFLPTDEARWTNWIAEYLLTPVIEKGKRE